MNLQKTDKRNLTKLIIHNTSSNISNDEYFSGGGAFKRLHDPWISSYGRHGNTWTLFAKQTD